MIDVATMIDELRDHVGMDINDLPDDKATLLLNRSWWEVIDKFPFREKEVTATFPTIIGTRSYGMPNPFEALRQLSILNPADNTHIPLDRMSIFEYEKVYIEGSDEYGFPQKYVREGCFARLWPTPDQVYTLTIKYWFTLADLSSTHDPEIPQVWHEVILMGGIWRTFMKAGDYPRCNQVKMHQASLIESIPPVEAKEAFDSHNAGIEVKGYSYDQDDL